MQGRDDGLAHDSHILFLLLCFSVPVHAIANILLTFLPEISVYASDLIKIAFIYYAKNKELTISIKMMAIVHIK